MKRLVSILLVLCASAFLGQRQSNPPENPPNGVQAPNQQATPDTNAQGPAQVTSQDIQEELQKEFDRAPLLKGTHVKPTVDDKTIVLEGTVETREQHDLVLQLAQQYAKDRKIQDKIVISQKS